MKRFLPLLGGLILLARAPAQEPQPVDLATLTHPVKPLLWKIEGKGPAPPSYLFGTIHLSDKRVTTLHPLAQRAFDVAAELYTETDQTGGELTPEEQAARNAVYLWKDDKTLSEVAGKDLAGRLDVELKFLATGYDAEALGKNKLWYLALELPMLPHKLKKDRLHLDLALWRRAQKAGKGTFGLEDPIGRVRAIDALPIEDQRKLFEVSIELLRTARESRTPVFHQMLDAYIRGDVATIAEFVTKDAFMGHAIDAAVGAKVAKILVSDRNEQMAIAIEKALGRPEADCCFFAVGSSHCVGERAVGELLAKAGFKVTPVAP